MNKATALRYLSVLESRGVAERSGTGWSLGLALFELGSHVPVRSIVVERVRPFLERLARETGESANLACLAGSSAIYLDRAEADRSLRMRSVPGDRLPLYCTGVGKAILSLLTEERARAILGAGPLPKINERTITDPEDVIKEARQAREIGLRPRPRGVRDRPDLHGQAPPAPRLRLRRRDQRVRPHRAHARDPETRERFLEYLSRAAAEAQTALEAAASVDAVLPPALPSSM